MSSLRIRFAAACSDMLLVVAEARPSALLQVHVMTSHVVEIG